MIKLTCLTENWKNPQKILLEKWLNEVKLNSYVYREADNKYEEFMKNKKLEFNAKERIGKKVSKWQKVKTPKRKGGFRGQKWFDELLFDLKVFPHYSDLKSENFLNSKEWLTILEKFEECFTEKDQAFYKWRKIRNSLEINFDIQVPTLGNIEIKTLPFKTNELRKDVERQVNIKKKPWDKKPSTFLCVLKTCDKELETFQLVGWLYEHEVFQLPTNKKFSELTGLPECYFCKLKKLRPPENILLKFLNLSKKKVEKNYFPSECPT